MANTTVKGKFNVVAENGDVRTIYPKTTGDQVLVDRSSNASVIPNDVANLQHIVNKMGSLALKSKVETSDFTTGTMISSLEDLKSNTDTGKIADATVVKDIESRVDTLENSNLVTVDELDAGLATKPDTEINDSVTSTSLTWSSKKLSDQLTTLNSNTSLLTSRINGLATLQEGSTTGDAELIDIRTGYDNINYQSAGEAVRSQVSELHNSVNQLNGVIYNESTEYIEVIDELTILTGNGLIVWDKVDDVYNIAALDQNNMNNTYTIGCPVKPGEQIKIKCVSYYNNYTGAGIIFSESTESIPLWNDSISIIPTSNYDCFAGNTSSAWKNCEYEVTVPERAKTVWVRGSNSDTTKIFKNKVIYNSKIPSKTSDLINDSNFIMDKKLPVICFDFDELRNNNIDSRFTILKSYGFTGNVVDSNNIEVTQKLVKMGFDISPYIGNLSNFDYISDSNGKLQQNIIEKMTRLRNYGLYNPIMISCSGHKDSEMLEEYLYENYDVKFIRARSFYKKDGTYEYMYPSGNSLIRRIISPIIMEGNRTVDEINDEIDMLVNNNVPIIMPMMHAFSSDGGSSDISEENYEKIVMHVKDLVDDGLVLCMNMMEYYKYRYPDEYANFIRGQTMSNDTRLENICVGYDDTVYDSPGDAVRTPINDIYSELSEIKAVAYTESPNLFDKTYSQLEPSVNISYENGWLRGYYDYGSGLNPAPEGVNRNTTYFIPAVGGKTVYTKTENPQTLRSVQLILAYDINKQLIAHSDTWVDHFLLPGNTRFIKITTPETNQVVLNDYFSVSYQAEEGIAYQPYQQPHYEFSDIQARAQLLQTNGYINDMKTSINLSAADMLPDYWKTYLDSKISTIREKLFSLENHGVVFQFFTDYHAPFNQRHTKAIIKYIADKTGINKIICGGDILDTHTLSAAKEKLWEFVSQDSPEGQINILGNHDTNRYGAAGNKLTLEQAYSIYGRLNEKSGNTNGKFYFYQDNASQRVRFIYLNTEGKADGTSYKFIEDTEQAQWFVDTLTNTPADYTILVFAHILFNPNSDPSSTLQSVTSSYFIAQLMDYYNARQNGTYYNVTWDFRNSTAKCAALITGHTHRDYSSQTSTSHIPLIATVCDANAANINVYNDLDRTTGTCNEQAVDLFFVDTENGTIETIRIGAGEDRSFSF